MGNANNTSDYARIAYSRYGDYGELNYSAFINYYRRKLTAHLDIRQSWNCLDLACGFGNFLSYLSQVGVEKFIGVDGSVEATYHARREFGESHVITADVFKYLTSVDNSFDLISALDFIEHINKKDMFRLLILISKRQLLGGWLLIRTPNANGLFGQSARYADITHEICFTPDSLSDVLSRCGYSVQSVWEDGPAIGSVKQTMHWFVWQIVRFGIRAINAAETGCWGDGVLTRNMWVLARKSKDVSF